VNVLLNGSAITGGDAILEEAASAERQADRLHIVDRDLEGLHHFRPVVVELAVPVRPHMRLTGWLMDVGGSWEILW
jgi:hypothetical protein